MLISAPRVLLEDATELTAGWVEVSGERIVAAGAGEPPRTADLVAAGTLVPGYVDAHNHGGGGASFVTEDPEAVRRATAAHRQHGTTSIGASLVTGEYPDLHRQVACLAELVEAGELLGIHLEGPWLAHEYKGAHPPQLLADPEPAEVAALLKTGRGTVKMATIAPEREGALESIHPGQQICVQHLNAHVFRRKLPGAANQFFRHRQVSTTGLNTSQLKQMGRRMFILQIHRL